MSKKTLSGAPWVNKFLSSTSVSSLDSSFKSNVEKFISSMKNAGATVTVSSTLRSPKRAYLMHWAWKLSKNRVKPDDIPAMHGVDIEWVHRDIKGVIDVNASISAARTMAAAYGMQNLAVAPALKSRHTEGKALDMNISWKNELKIKNAKDEEVIINTLPRDGMNAQLQAVGKSFNVVKSLDGVQDKLHWSTDGK